MTELITASAHDTGLTDKSCHMVCTSPPYWGLRKYQGEQGIDWPAVSYAPMPGLPELHIQGCEPGCEHEWQDGPITATGRNDADSGIRKGRAEAGDKKSTQGAYCIHCGGWHGELGLEPTPEMYIGHMVLVMREMWRVLRDDGTLWCNLGDGFQDKQLMGMPWRLAFALQADGWYLRSDIIWAKPNPMPESVTDRPTKSHEYLFLLTKQAKYFYDADAVREAHAMGSGGWQSRYKNGKAILSAESSSRKSPYFQNGAVAEDGHTYNPAGRNRRTVWTIATQPTPHAHFATYPEKLVEPCIRAGTSQKGCCAECGAPWERVVERTNMVVEPGPSRGERSQDGQLRTQVNGTMKEPPTSTTTGWKPTCDHDAEVVPCTVLDPFSGSGTTGRVALRLNRKYIGVDISQEYHDTIADKRLGNIQRELL